MKVTVKWISGLDEKQALRMPAHKSVCSESFHCILPFVKVKVKVKVNEKQAFWMKISTCRLFLRVINLSTVPTVHACSNHRANSFFFFNEDK